MLGTVERYFNKKISDGISKGAKLVTMGSMEKGMKNFLFFSEGAFGVKEE